MRTPTTKGINHLALIPLLRNPVFKAELLELINNILKIYWVLPEGGSQHFSKPSPYTLVVNYLCHYADQEIEIQKINCLGYLKTKSGIKWTKQTEVLFPSCKICSRTHFATQHVLCTSIPEI